MSKCPPKQKKSKLEGILNFLSLCAHTGVVPDKRFGQVDCKKCYYTCKEGNQIEVKCKQCQSDDKKTGASKFSSECSKSKLRKLVSSVGKCSKKRCDKDEKDILCKKCKEICEECKQPIPSNQEDKNTTTEDPPPGYKEFDPKKLTKLDCKVCGFEAQADGTKDFVCYPCIDKAKKNLYATSDECESGGGKKADQGVKNAATENPPP